MVIKLNLGCYNKKMYGFTNVDIRPEVNPDLVDDVFTLGKMQDNSVDLIYACHVLEHADRNTYHEILKRWCAVLKPGGVLRVSVPDMRAVCEHYIYHHDLELLLSFFWGSQRHPYDYHRIGWDEESLTIDLIDAGFSKPSLYEHTNTEHYYVDDYSQAYMPHMDRFNGRLMSLNMEATKPCTT